MMAAVKRGAARRARSRYLEPEHLGIGSINSPMQCMMKEVCAQCLQKHVDPRDGQGDDRLLLLQPGPAARRVDFKNLNDRLKTNSLVEKQTNLWLTHLLSRASLPHV